MMSSETMFNLEFLADLTLPRSVDGVLPKVYRVNIVEAHDRLNILFDIPTFKAQSTLNPMAICEVLDRLVTISTPYANAVRLRLLESDTAGFGGLKSSSSSSTTAAGGDSRNNKERILVLDRLLNLIELYTSSDSDSENLLEIVSRLFKIFGNLGAVDISTRQISRFVQLMNFIEKRGRQDSLLKEFMGGFKRLGRIDPSTLKAHPISFFLLDGSDSGLLIENAKFPAMKDMDVSFWFNLAQFGTKDNPFGAKLLRLTGSSGQSLTVQLIDPYVIQVQCISTSGASQIFRSTRAMGTDVIQFNVWYHFRLVFKHARAFTLFSHDELFVSIDKTERILIKESLKFPDFFKTDTNFNCAFGENLTGELSNIYVFSEALSDDVMDSISSLAVGKTNIKFGCEFVSNIDVKCPTPKIEDSDSLSISIGSATSLLMMGNIDIQKMNDSLAKLILALHPARVHMNIAIDVHSKFNALLCKNTYAWSSRSPRDMLRSIGGCAMFYHMFAMLIEIKTHRSCSPNTQVIAHFFELVSTFLKENKANIKDFRERKFCQVISQILSLQTPEVKQIVAGEGTSVLVAMISLRETLRFARDSEMEKLVVKYLLTNFSIWKNANKPFQISLVTYLSQDIFKNRSKYYDLKITPWLLRTIDKHYFENNDETTKEMRIALFHILRTLFTFEEGSLWYVLSYMNCCSNHLVLKQMSDLLLECCLVTTPEDFYAIIMEFCRTVKELAIPLSKMDRNADSLSRAINLTELGKSAVVFLNKPEFYYDPRDEEEPCLYFKFVNILNEASQDILNPEYGFQYWTPISPCVRLPRGCHECLVRGGHIDRFYRRFLFLDRFMSTNYSAYSYGEAKERARLRALAVDTQAVPVTKISNLQHDSILPEASSEDMNGIDIDPLDLNYSVDASLEITRGIAVGAANHLVAPKGESLSLSDESKVELSKRLMLVCSDDSFTSSITEYLTECGNTLTTFTTAESAFDTLKPKLNVDENEDDELTFDAILVDVNLLDITGIMFTSKCRTELKLDLPILVISDSLDLKREARQCGADGFALKSASLKDITLLLRDIVNHDSMMSAAYSSSHNTKGVDGLHSENIQLSEDMRLVRASAINDQSDQMLVCFSFVTAPSVIQGGHTESGYTESESESDLSAANLYLDRSNRIRSPDKIETRGNPLPPSDLVSSSGSGGGVLTRDDQTTELYYRAPIDSTLSKSRIGNSTFSGLTSNSKRPAWIPKEKWSSDEYEVGSFEVRRLQLHSITGGILLLTSHGLHFQVKANLSQLDLSVPQVEGEISIVGVEKTTSYLCGLSDVSEEEAKPTVDYLFWPLERVIGLFARKHLIEFSGIEIFFGDFSSEVYFLFDSAADAESFFKTITKQSLPALTTSVGTLNPKVVISTLNWTDLWRRRVISNFEYLMRLNILAGRSFNDIGQYPVFPWILSDFTSSTIDLNDPKVYRDLSKPIGALNPTRLDEFMDRFDSFDPDDTTKFMYGSHYSSAGIVLHFLLRQEPYTTLAINLQGGHFDVPDRIFFDLQSSWEGCNNSMTDVHEMIPELFCCPEVLLNTSKLPLGDRQDGMGPVDDITVPPWAENVFDFIRIHRKALESEYVSENLHHWIDLIFGYKQRGEAAVEAHNLFHYLTYEDSISLDTISDPVLREAAKSQVINFGQTPSQIFTREHPKRMSSNECLIPICSNENSLTDLQIFKCNDVKYMMQDLQIYACKVPETEIVGIFETDEKIFVVDRSHCVKQFYWDSFPMSDNVPFQIRYEKTRTPVLSAVPQAAVYLEEVNKSYAVHKILDVFTDGDVEADADKEADAAGMETSVSSDSVDAAVASSRRQRNFMCPQNQQLAFVRSASSNGHKIVSCGYWGNYARIDSLEDSKDLGHFNYSSLSDQITCIHSEENMGYVFTGHKNGAVKIWKFTESLHKVNLVHTLCGHVDSVLSLSFSEDLDIVLSGDEMGVLCLHVVTSGNYIRSVYPITTQTTVGGGGAIGAVGGFKQSADLVLLASAGSIVTFCTENVSLSLFWVNGQQLRRSKVRNEITCFAVNGSSDILICGRADGAIEFRGLFTLDVLAERTELCVYGGIRCLRFSRDQQFLFVGSGNGSLSVCADPKARRMLLHYSITRAAILGPSS